ncbi:hypothetical protein C8F04DRAFT_1198021 [Mycena alexandri]|uniref:Secreted protein n=1 Tax=Mycena alexandri TaxID=1745969 RepID=A0AAD6S1D8_9AGAR|nr:hypothetical protein C8F04DRAFT_1198021 [Mycena alexandri]
MSGPRVWLARCPLSCGSLLCSFAVSTASAACVLEVSANWCRGAVIREKETYRMGSRRAHVQGGGREKRWAWGGKELPTVLCAKHGVHLLVALVARRAVERECGCAVDADNDVGMGSALRPLRETVRERGSQREFGCTNFFSSASMRTSKSHRTDDAVPNSSAEILATVRPPEGGGGTATTPDFGG